MARYNKTTFSNSHTAASYQFNADASEAGATILLNVLYQNPAGAKIYSIGPVFIPGPSLNLKINCNFPGRFCESCPWERLYRKNAIYRVWV